MEVIEVILGLATGLIIGVLAVKLMDKSKLQLLTDQHQQEKATMQSAQVALDKELFLAKARVEELQLSVQALNGQLEEERSRRHESEKLYVSKDSDNKNLLDKMESEQKRLQEIQDQLRLEFENVANKIIKQQTQDFNLQSQKGLFDLLSPLKEKLQSFEKKVEETYEKGLKDQSDLRAEFKKIYDLSVTLDKDAKDLTKALRSDSKRQGNWGEIILERVLERSGLTKDQEYYLQFTAKNEEGATLRPDVVVRLPEDKHLIIDSKVSLTAYSDYISAEDEPQRQKKLKEHLDSVRRHVKELSDKRYDQLLGINSPDFVLMFMPVEPAFALAVQNDSELFNTAWRDRVVIVSPTTLLATLRTVSSIWKYEKQTQNALDIAERGGKLYDKFESFVADLENIGQHLERADKSYREAHKKLASGSGNILRQVEQLKKMGVSTKKSLPEHLIESAENQDE